MPLPYRDVTGGFLNLIQMVDQTGRQLGGTAETAVGEGRNDAPVGTTIAMIEQAQKVVNAVHKRMHSAQQKEFGLLKQLFRRDPEAIWRNNPNPNFAADRAKLMLALENNDIVPKADPNTASQTMRIQKAIAIYTLAQQNPSAFDQKAVYGRIFSMIGVEDAKDLFSKEPPGPPPVDETKRMSAQAALVSAQAKVLDASVRAQEAQGNQGVKLADVQTKNFEVLNKHAATKAKAAVEAANIAGKIKLEGLRLKQSEIIHHGKIKNDQINKGLDFQQAAENHKNNIQLQALDITRQREKDQMQTAKEQNQAAAQRLHEVALANHEAKLARENDFLEPTQEKE